MQPLFVRLCFAMVLTLMTGCGIKGDLYLPDDSSESFTLTTVEHADQ